MSLWTWALVAALAGILSAGILTGTLGARDSVCEVEFRGRTATYCLPRLCEEDEALWWVSDDVRGCVHFENVR